MSAVERLALARRLLLAGVVLRGLLWSGAALVAAVGLFAALDWAMDLPRWVRAAALPVAVAGGIAALSAALWRGRSVRSPLAVALWLEARLPELRYSLVTLADPRTAAAVQAAQLEARVAQARVEPALARGLAAALAWPAGLALAAALLLALLPPAAVARVARPRPGDLLDAPGRGRDAAASGLSPLAATVTPPPYTGARAFGLDDPAQIAAVSGSAVRLRGPRAAGAVQAFLGDSLLAVAAGAGGWEISFAMPASPVALRLASGEAQRLVSIEPAPDTIPLVTLLAPERDSVLREAGGSAQLSATVADDYGLDAAWFEFIISSGDRENYSFRSGTVGRAALENARSAERRTTLSLDSLRLQPGDIVHLRAVATDHNNVTGPGRGVSATRTWRLARPGEYDSLTLDIPPFEGDTAALSQRVLVMMAEALERRRPRLTRDVVVGESQAIGRDQARLRRRISEIIFARLEGEEGEHSHSEDDGHDHSADEARANLSPDSILAAAEAAGAAAVSGEALDFSHDESPVVAINRPLLEAYNSMWEAGRWLSIGEPDDALPHMRAALAAIQRARQAERLYLRGRPPAAVVDLAAARLAGRRDDARGGAREPRAALGASRARLVERLGGALRLVPGDAAAATDSLLMLRIESLASHPRFAAALGRAIADLRSGRNATAALIRAREAIGGEPRSFPGLAPWLAAP